MTPMKPAAAVARRHGPNRILVALAAAWMIVSLAIGGAVAAESNAEAGAQSVVTGGTTP